MASLFDCSPVHASWQPLIDKALSTLPPDYLNHLATHDWLPGPEKVFNAFSLPFAHTNIILFGESPYPRTQSANGYAFWDAAVGSLWSDKGLSKAVNRATSLRNFIKMLLVADGTLTPDDVSQHAIAASPTIATKVQTADALFNNMLAQGILLLNASLVLSDKPVAHDAKAWRGFMSSLLESIYIKNKKIKLLLMGNISKVIANVESAHPFNRVISEHPYNISFIHNPTILHFFKPMQLLQPRPMP